MVLDPFMGSGQTAIAALTSNRHYVGYEINEDYVGLARTRIAKFGQAGGAASPLDNGEK
jgi:site-specific DNA-methyltransferase (adenine-specific)